MNSPTTRPDEQRLAEVLRAEADRLVVTEDGLADLRARLARQPTPSAPRRSTRWRRGLPAGAAALALAAAVSVVVGIGLRPDATPQPVETPLPPPTAAPSYPAQPARSTVDVYRVRSGPGALPRLAVETVAITPPLDPRQAMEALFTLPPLNAADHSVLDDGRDVVASTRETEDALVVDLSAVDQVSRAPSRAVAEVWVQAWVRTLQSAYGSDKPVLITLRGRPTTLYGAVDTSRPIRSTGAPTVQDQRIFVPRPGQSVTSPVSFGANLPAGTFLWKVTDDAGRTVERTGVAGRGRLRRAGVRAAPGPLPGLRHRRPRLVDAGLHPPGRLRGHRSGARPRAGPGHRPAGHPAADRVRLLRQQLGTRVGPRAADPPRPGRPARRLSRRAPGRASPRHLGPGGRQPDPHGDRRG